MLQQPQKKNYELVYTGRKDNFFMNYKDFLYALTNVSLGK